MHPVKIAQVHSSILALASAQCVISFVLQQICLFLLIDRLPATSNVAPPQQVMLLHIYILLAA